MLAREKSFHGYRGTPLKRHLRTSKSSDPEKAALLRAEHKREKRDDRRGDDGKRDDSDRKTSKKTKKPRTAKKRSTSNPKSKEKKKVKAKISCHCHKSPIPPVICDDACCQYDGECQSSSKEDAVMEDKMEARVTTTTRDQDIDDDEGERIYEQRERVRERNFKKKTDDTCSCASCVLKKMCRNDCICCCCVAFIFILCLFIAFVLVCKSIPCLRSKLTLFGTSDELESDRLKRKIEVPTDMQWDGLDKKHRISSNKWDYDRLPGHPVPHSIDPTGYGDMNLPYESELTKIIDTDKLSEIQGNERLREFYKKLVLTDAEIRKLKKDYLFNIDNSHTVASPDRAKRSLGALKNPFKIFHSKRKNETKEPNTDKANAKETKDKRIKRYDTNEDGLFIEKNKVSIQFVPNGRKPHKCSHVPKESDSNEKQVKSSFYQSSQRLDELLDKFMDKNVMEMMGEPYSRAMIAMKKCKHKNKINEDKNETPTKKVTEDNGEFGVSFNDAKNPLLKNSFETTNNNINKNIQALPLDDSFKLLDDQIAKNKLIADNYNKNNQQADANAVHDFLLSHGGYDTKTMTTTTNMRNNKENALKKGNTETTTHNYNLLMSISTMMYKDNENQPSAIRPDVGYKMKVRTPVGRRLMQTEMDDDEQVSVMPASERDSERKKRRDEETNPNNLINPNWKGAMPLYPDEVNAITKPGPVIVTTEENPLTGTIFLAQKNGKIYRFKYRTAENEDAEYLTDMQYIEDYFHNKYDRIAEMAQAYSDYGVLNDKNVKNKRVDQRYRNFVKPDTNANKTPEISLIGVEKSLESTSSSEGFRLDIVPSSSHFDSVFKTLKKHIKFTGTPIPHRTTTTYRSVEPIFTGDLFGTTKAEVLNVNNILKVERPVNMELEFRNIKKRSLKSIDYYENDDQKEAFDSLMNFRGIFNGLQKKFSSKLGSAQDYAIRVASDYIHDGIYKRDVDSVDVDSRDDIVADENMTVRDNITENDTTKDIYNITEAVKLVANKTESPTAQAIENIVNIATGDVHNDTGTSISDFFMKLANWFSLLDTLDLSVNKSQEGNFSATNNITERAEDQSKFELSLPLYDADMIENIGHRSRVLLAVNETEAVGDSTPDGDGKDDRDTSGLMDDGAEIDNTTTNQETVNANENKTKSIVKRSAEGNLILWDDVYNDEYGGDADGVDGSDADKNVASKPAERKHPKDWLKKMINKLKQGAAKLELKHGEDPDKEKDNLPTCEKCNEGKAMGTEPTSQQELGRVPARRFYRKADSDYSGEERKTDFTVLTAKMKKICQKAAKDISLSKKLEVREESKEGQVASKLMQQLISLMSELVDYQVHEKTCRKLPLDLQNFLEWLTNPDSTIMTYHGKDTILTQKEPVEEIHTLDVMPPGDENLEPKADCMSVMSAVRDLLNRYDSLSDDDKSKMSGVKEYLEAQMEYLQKQLYMANDFNMFNTEISRFKRNAKASDLRHHFSKNNNSLYVTFRKYIRKPNKYGKGGNNPTKHFRVHAPENESSTSKVLTIGVTVDQKAMDEVKPVKSNNKVNKKKPKRNLKDIYYKALEEAKLMTAATEDAKLTTVLAAKATEY